MKKYWALPSEEISDFQNGNVIVGAGWPYQVSALKAAKFSIGSTVPAEGATGWADTWMLAAKAPHPNCAYKWMQYISTPQVQALQAITYGETPDNAKACAIMDKLQAGSCAVYHADAPASYIAQARPVEDAAGDLRQRPEQLRAIRQLGHSLEHAGEVASESDDRTAGTRPADKSRSQVIRNVWLLRLSTALWRRPWARATLLLTPPLAWFLLVYVASLVVLLVTAFWIDQPVHHEHRQDLDAVELPRRSSPRRRTCRTSGRRSRWPPR